MTTRFHHAGIVVPDLEKGIAFYTHLLGLTEQFRSEWNESQPGVEDVIDLPVREDVEPFLDRQALLAAQEDPERFRGRGLEGAQRAPVRVSEESQPSQGR